MIASGDFAPAVMITSPSRSLHGVPSALRLWLGAATTVIKETVLRVGDLELDLLQNASRRGRDISLLPREFQLLEYLVRNEGQVVSRAMLLQHVWDLHFDPTTNIIDVYVGRVRRKVDGQQVYPLIHTVRGVGYCLRAPS
jgi:two-component system OmpR family response regulator